MVSLFNWITKDDKKIKISATGQPISSTDVLPKGESEESIKMQSERVARFAKQRAKEAGELTRAGIEAVRQKRIEKSIQQGEREAELNDMIDKILENPNTTPSQKFRGVQRFGQKYFRELTSDQNKMLAGELKDLAKQIRQAETKTGQQTARVQASTPVQVAPSVPSSAPSPAPSTTPTPVGGRSPLAFLQPVSTPTPTQPERVVERTERLSEAELAKLPATVREEILASRLIRK